MLFVSEITCDPVTLAHGIRNVHENTLPTDLDPAGVSHRHVTFVASNASLVRRNFFGKLRES